MTVQLLAELCEVYDGGFLGAHSGGLGRFEDYFWLFGWMGGGVPSSGLFLLSSSVARLSNWMYRFSWSTTFTGASTTATSALAAYRHRYASCFLPLLSSISSSRSPRPRLLRTPLACVVNEYKRNNSGLIPRGWWMGLIGHLVMADRWGVNGRY